VCGRTICLFSFGFRGCWIFQAFPTQNSAYEQNQIQFTVDDNVPAPTLCLSFCQGTAADAVISPDSKIPFPVDKVLFAVGSRLAQLHKIPVVTEAQLGTYKDGGACAVIDHISDKIKTTIASSPHTCDHPFHAFYTTQLNELKLSMEAASESDLMPWGVIHGDPFLDNCLATMDTGTVEATWVDFEDVTVGPLLFDFACCIIGSCFRPSPDNTLDLNRLAALSKGYFSTRTLTPREMELLIPFLKLTLLTSCTWRFVNFNIHHREISDCRDSYVEFQQRIISLLNPELIAKITTCLTS